MKTWGAYKRDRAITLVEVMIVIAVVVFLALILLPARSRDHVGSTRIHCASNLKQVALAFRIWEGDNGDKYPAEVYTNELGALQFTNVYRYYQVMSNELNNPKVVVCPVDKKHVAATNFTSDFNDSHVSYFMGVGADETMPQTLLAGDYNIDNGMPLTNHFLDLTTNQTVRWTHEVHEDAGNVALADGSVQQWSSSALQSAIGHTGLETNRLMFPEMK
jgi:prepilin-type processing-associated H-X9-DG protein